MTAASAAYLNLAVEPTGTKRQLCSRRSPLALGQGANRGTRQFETPYPTGALVGASINAALDITYREMYDPHVLD